MNRSKFTPLENAVWAAAYVAQLHLPQNRDAKMAAQGADKVLLELRRAVLPPDEWGGE